MNNKILMGEFEELADRFTADGVVSVYDLHNALGLAAIRQVRGVWEASEAKRGKGRRAFYLSAEYLMGRAVLNNLLCMGALDQVKTAFAKYGHTLEDLEEIPDAALGNGGLGRLAACYLDSAATTGVPLDGYGIRYRHGLFRQRIEDGFQREEPDDWLGGGDPWSLRREGEARVVSFGDGDVLAVPYITPIIGYGAKCVGTLKLWQSESLSSIEQPAGPLEWERAGELSGVLYPDDSTVEGKMLRLKQQYFFCSASLQDMIDLYKESHGEDLTGFGRAMAVQLNDTHPVIAIPELIRILMQDHGFAFADALAVAEETFHYTNHTVMPEALETWSAELFRKTVPQVYAVVEMLEDRVVCDLAARRLAVEDFGPYKVIQGGAVHMARMAVRYSAHVNGVSQIHSDIVRDRLFARWSETDPEKFTNVTNGVTQRRWLQLCNPGLGEMITDLCGEGWQCDLSRIAGLRSYAGDAAALERFGAVKRDNKVEFARYLREKAGVRLDPDMLFDVQVKRIHEYKRQLLNALCVLDTYFALKEGELKGFAPTAFLFSGKAYPSYVRAKGIIKLVGEIARLVEGDPAMKGLLQVVMVPDYNVSMAEKLIPAAELSQQISTAGTEASGTGNMKLSLNGAVTVGTWDGANIEIFRDAGEENNYPFGARVEELEALGREYDPAGLYKAEPRIRRVLDTLTDGTLDDGGEGWFEDLRGSLLEGAAWHRPDNYFLLHDFLDYARARRRAIADSADKAAFWRKGLLNTAGCGNFSSDRAVLEYARKIWGVEPGNG